MSFNDEYRPNDGLRDEGTGSLQQSYEETADKAKVGARKIGNKTKEHGTNYVKKKLGVNNDAAKNKAVSIARKTGKRLTNAAAKGTKAAAKKVATAMGKLAAKVGAAALKVLAPFALYIIAALIVVGIVAAAAAIIIDEEYSRTNQANYQHVSYTDGNKLMANYVSSAGNVFFNKETKRYELAKGQAPTEANKLYYVYYAIMVNQSRWFVEYERTDTKPGDDKAGTSENPYFKPIKRDDAYTKYTLDGYMFNNNVIDKVGLRPVSSGKGVQIEDLIDETAADSVKRLSMNVNLLYLLNSTLNGEMYGTGKSQMYFAEQFVKPVYHDENYNFKALTEYRDMTDEEKAKYASKAHGDKEDSSLETKFQEKYELWGKTLDAQNEARGGSSAKKDDSKNSSSSSATAEGIDNPILKKAVEWGLSKQNQGWTYSMSGSRNGSDGTADCSGFVAQALREAGLSDIPLYSTVSMLAASNALGQSGDVFKEVDYKTAKKGTIIVVGGLGGGGAGGHVFFLLEDFHGDNTKVLEVTAAFNGVAAENTFIYASMNYNQVVALEPTGKGASSSDSPKDSDGPKSGKKGKSADELTTSIENEYKNKITTGVINAQSKVYDTGYNPSLIKKLYTNEEVNYPRYRPGDYLISEPSVQALSTNLDVATLNSALNNVSQTITGSIIVRPNGKLAREKASVSPLGSNYTGERDKIVKWSLEHGYNPAWVIAVISTLTDTGSKNLVGSKYNFTNDPTIVELEKKASDSGDDKDESADTTTTTTTEESDSESPETGTGRGIQNTNYGAQYYNLKKQFDTIEGGLDFMLKKLSEDNEELKWDKTQAEKLSLSAKEFEKVNRLYTKVGGKGTPSVKVAELAKDLKVYTYEGNGTDDKEALSVISLDGKTEETLINGHKKYYKKTEYVEFGSGVVPDNDGSESAYAIKRGEDGNPEMKTGVWDYGFGSIFKISKMTYNAYEVGIDERGKYYLALNDAGDVLAYIFNGKADLAEDTQYQILGATTAFGSLDMSNEIAESQYKIEQVIAKLHRGEDLNGDDISTLNAHKESGTSIKTRDGVKEVSPGNFIVSTKPVLKKDPVLSDANGAQYLLDYVQNYETYVPSSVKTGLDVVNRYRSMNDMNENAQTVLNKIAAIFNNQLKDDSKSGSSSDGGYDASRFTGETYKGTGAYKGDIPVAASGVQYQDEFMNKMSEGAMNSWVKYGVLPSVVMAMAINESGWGRSELAVQQNNLFGIKGTGDAGTGSWATGEDDANGNSYTINANFAKYSSFSASIEHHGRLLSGNTGMSNYLATVKEEDPLKAVTAIKNGGYATAVDYIDVTMSILKSSSLEEYDKYAIAYTDKHGFEPTASGKVNNNPEQPSTSQSSGNSSVADGSVWGDGTGFWDGVVDFFMEIQDVFLGLFHDGQTFDPTMFSLEQTRNEMPLYTLNNKKTGVAKTYAPGTIITNGSDAYNWSRYANKLSNENATMLLRQFVASLETRDNRPVYYDEIYDTFGNYDLSRILEENFKDAVTDLFKKEEPKKTTNSFRPEIEGELFSGTKVADSKVSRAFGWYKEGNEVKFSPGILFHGDSKSDVKALKSGKVVYVGDSDWGKTIIVRTDGDTEQIAYAGFGQTAVNKGDSVSKDAVIGKADGKGEIYVIGIRLNADVSKGLPSAPTTADELDKSVYFDLASQFGIRGEKLSEFQKDVNGYDMNSSTKKPSPGDVKSGKKVKLGDYIAASGDLIMPLKLEANQSATVTSPFGEARTLTLQDGSVRQDISDAVDLVTGSNTTRIIAAADGEVVLVNHGAYGEGVILKHSDSLYTLYWHQVPGTIPVKVGDHVKQGDDLGQIGTSGMSTGVHLHFAVATGFANGVTTGHVDPMPLIK